MNAEKRKGWRKCRDWRTDAYTHNRLDLTVQRDPAKSWFFYGNCTPRNSLCCDPPRWYATWTDAAIAAEIAANKESKS